MKKNVFSLVFLIAAVLICAALSVGMLVCGPSGAAGNEVLSPFPSGVSDRALHQAADWFDDHFSLRQELITAYAQLNAALFGISGSESVFLGRDGWLFFAGEIPDYRGSPAVDLYAAANNLAVLKSAAASRGRDFVFLCVPNKSTVYPQHMPRPGIPDDAHAYRKLYALLAQMGVKTVDILPAFRAEEEMYFSHDSHWNSRGAALAADLITAALGVDSEFYADVFALSQPHSGDLYTMLYPALQDREPDPQYGGALSFFFREGSGTRPDSITIRTRSDGEGKLLMYRDSFGELLFPYLAAQFGEATFSRSTEYNPLAEDADAVVLEIVERNLGSLARAIPAVAAPAVEPDLSELVLGNPICLTDGEGRLDGFRLISGSLPHGDSPVCLLADDGAYACFLLEDGRIAAYLPESVQVIAVVNQFARHPVVEWKEGT